MTNQTQTQTQSQTLNGVNVTRLNGTIEAVKNDPQLADFKFRARNKWHNGGYNEAKITDFYGTKSNLSHKNPFVIAADEPDVLLGTDNGANPVEILLAALSGCMTTTLAYKAALQGRKLEQIESQYEGDIDLQGLLEVRNDVNKGYNEIRVKFKVRGDITEDQVKELVKGSPVYDTLIRPIRVKIDVEKV